MCQTCSDYFDMLVETAICLYNKQLVINDECFITNRAMADRTTLPSILSTLATCRHSIFGHICRLSDSTRRWSSSWMPVITSRLELVLWRYEILARRSILIRFWMKNCDFDSVQFFRVQYRQSTRHSVWNQSPKVITTAIYRNHQKLAVV